VAIVIHSREPDPVGEEVFQVQIPSRLEEKTPIIRRVLERLRHDRFIGPQDEMQVRLCLDEAIINAMRHGNRYDESKSVTIRLYAGSDEWAIRIEDEGDGFIPADVPDVNDPDSLLLEGGRGILLITQFMDHVWYYSDGRALQLSKRRITFLRKVGRVPRQLGRRLRRWLSE
jgi:serine/threonine-protein kinase RsbW